MKGLIEQAVIVGCDVDHCSKLLIFNRGIERQDLDEEILRAGWLPLPQPTGDEPFQQEHACPAHAARIRAEQLLEVEEAGHMSARTQIFVTVLVLAATYVLLLAAAAYSLRTLP